MYLYREKQNVKEIKNDAPRMKIFHFMDIVEYVHPRVVRTNEQTEQTEQSH